MLDPIALLQSLTLPAGATTGRRIELDGVNGVIRVFDTNGVKRIQLSDPTDATRSGRILLFGAPTTIGDQLNGGDIFAGVLNNGAANERLFLDLDAPVPNWGTLFPTILMTTQAKDLSIPSTIELDSDLMRFTGITAFAQLIFDNGPNLYRGASATELKTDGSLNAVSDLLVNAVSLPRGKMGTPFDASANDVARAAGVNTDMAVTFTADATRLYEICVKLQCNFGTAGVVYALDAVEGGTVGGADGTVIDRFARWSAAETPAGSLTGHVYASVQYRPTAGSKTVRVGNDAGSGGTITGVGGATIRRQLWVKDIGAR